MTPDDIEHLERRLGRPHARIRLGIERDLEARILARRIDFFDTGNWYSAHSILRSALRASGMYRRGRSNAERIEVRQHDIVLPRVPGSFDGFTILQLSDLHVEMNEGAMRRLADVLRGISCDLCVLTGDYRAKIYGPFDAALDGMARLRRQLPGPVYGVLGNHDSIRMVPALEAMGIRMLLNESEPITRAGHHLHLAGIDDAHYYRTHSIEKAATAIPAGAFSILLSHTPEVYRQAAHAEFDVMLSGHTHGGQICLPGAVPVMLAARLPRRMGSGSWRYREMVGYTSTGVGSSLVAARFNCPPEITLHRLERGRAVA